MNGTFRWCTDRLKIKPSADRIKAIMAEEDKIQKGVSEFEKSTVGFGRSYFTDRFRDKM